MLHKIESFCSDEHDHTESYKITNTFSVWIYLIISLMLNFNS